MNPEVVTWLRSPEGEAWSRMRIEKARQQALISLHGGGGNQHSPTLGTTSASGSYVLGLFSLKLG